ncbi:bifunctional folylpolyglutamate synthase/dihydrofolate synthase [Maribacter sp. 2307ULW6-5]|uniref:bifunctional folylpolyglutamate synthase/dihydrofolate synthase n=1 Tax=Maribacter sp. 2307ULW6-5 TaxID=3386275 RepID=UPI0039BD26CB
MTYEQTLQWMFGQLPMYQREGKRAYNAKMDGIKHFAQHLGHPETGFKSIHVAGTNGKGSSSHMLASILQEAGYRVGLYTSPHLKDFRERIRINGNKVPEAFVCRFIFENKTFLEAHQLSFFEMTVGMAFSYFAVEQVDVAVVEVGLGGRLDSTNIISPEVSLITNIGYDHMDMLGNTLPEIAFEKAGIIKPGVPVVISQRQEETTPVFERVAKERGSPLFFADGLKLTNYPSSLLGHYQKRNSLGVLAVLDKLPQFPVSEEDKKRGLLRVQENTGLLGRWQVLGQRPLTICDTAHNRDGLALVVKQVQQQRYQHLHVVLGVVRDKDLAPLLALLPQEARYYFCSPAVPRGKPAEALAEAAGQFGLLGHIYASVHEAYEAAQKAAATNDLVFVGGSTFTVAEVV